MTSRIANGQIIVIAGETVLVVGEKRFSYPEQDELSRLSGGGVEGMTPFSSPTIDLTVRADDDESTGKEMFFIFTDVWGIPSSLNYSLQWQNDRGAGFRDIERATGHSVTVHAGEGNMRSAWRVVLTIHDESEEVVFFSMPIHPADWIEPTAHGLPAESFHSDETTLINLFDERECERNCEPFAGTEMSAGPVADPEVVIKACIDGNTLQPGTKVTLIANVSGISDEADYTIHWQNNLSGAFRNVTGATNRSLTFPASVRNVNCAWRVEMATAS